MNILERIGAVLGALFPDTTIYMENQKSGFKEPSFFVSSIGTRATPELFTRQKRTYSYQMVYFPNPEKPNADMERMQDLLLDNFLVLPKFATIRNREFQVVDGALTVTFDVVIRAYGQDTGTKLQKLDENKAVVKPMENLDSEVSYD